MREALAMAGRLDHGEWFDENERAYYMTYVSKHWPCKACGGMPLPDYSLRYAPPLVRTYLGADPCLGWLPGVRHACCGHGGTRDDRGGPYLMLRDGQRLAGAAALAKMRELGGTPPGEEVSAA